jgi:hypothetical protein
MNLITSVWYSHVILPKVPALCRCNAVTQKWCRREASAWPEALPVTPKTHARARPIARTPYETVASGARRNKRASPDEARGSTGDPALRQGKETERLSTGSRCGRTVTGSW